MKYLVFLIIPRPLLWRALVMTSVSQSSEIEPDSALHSMGSLLDTVSPSPSAPPTLKTVISAPPQYICTKPLLFATIIAFIYFLEIGRDAKIEF